MKFEIRSYRPLATKSKSLKGSFFVFFPNIELYIRLNFFERDGKQWFGYPIAEYVTLNGRIRKRKYCCPLAFFKEPARGAFEKKLQKKLKVFLSDSE